MATDTYFGGRATDYDARHDPASVGEVTQSAYRDPAGTAFLWIAWVVAFAFWAFTMSSFAGILEAIARGGPGSIRGGVDMGGGAYILMDVIGAVIVLGAVLAWVMARRATRKTEAATAELYASASSPGRPR